jgi:hypothetical protein
VLQSCGAKAVGSFFLKFSAQVAACEIYPDLSDVFCPVQFGAGCKGGSERIVHQVRMLARSKTIVKLDFLNAFNFIDRNAFFEEFNWAYS